MRRSFKKNEFFEKILNVKSWEGKSLNTLAMNLKETFKSAIGIENVIQYDKRIFVARGFNMWTQKNKGSRSKQISGTQEGFDANIRVYSL